MCKLQLPFVPMFLCIPCSANALTPAWVLGSSNHTKVRCYMMLCDSIVAKACRVLRKDDGMGWGTRKFRTVYRWGVRQRHHPKVEYLWCFGWKTQTKIFRSFSNKNPFWVSALTGTVHFLLQISNFFHSESIFSLYKYIKVLSSKKWPTKAQLKTTTTTTEQPTK